MTTKALACRAGTVVVPSLSGHREMVAEIRITAHVMVIRTASTPSLWEAPPRAGANPGIWRSVHPLWPPPTAVARTSEL